MFEANNLTEWLAYIERIHPVTWDFGLDRVRSVAERMGFEAGPSGGLKLPFPVITVGGTNGKGSTVAMLESVYRHAGYKTGAHTSPHLIDFEERLRLNGLPVDGNDLLSPFAAVERARHASDPPVSLTYFEFTLLAMVQAMVNAHAAGQLDVALLEVGLGGRLDAVNLFDTDCAVLTSIDLDHMAYLGDTRDAIGAEKACIMRAGKPAIVSDPVPPQSVIDHAQNLGADLWLSGRDFNVSGDPQQWRWAGRGRRYNGLGYPALRGANQLLNAAGVLAATQAMRSVLPVTAQAVRNGMAFVELAGRFQVIPGQPALVLDVAHNPNAVAVLTENLDAMGFFARTHAVFGAMADKDLPSMLKRIAPLVDCWYLCDLPTPRATTALAIQALVEPLLAPPQNAIKNIATKSIKSLANPEKTSETFTQATAAPTLRVSTHASPLAAFHQALACADPADRIVVFGSFYAVGGVLAAGLPQLRAKHLPNQPPLTAPTQSPRHGLF